MLLFKVGLFTLINMDSFIFLATLEGRGWNQLPVNKQFSSSSGRQVTPLPRTVQLPRKPVHPPTTALSLGKSFSRREAIPRTAQLPMKSVHHLTIALSPGKALPGREAIPKPVINCP